MHLKKVLILPMFLLLSACESESEISPAIDTDVADSAANKTQSLNLSRDGVNRVLDEMGDEALELDAQRILPDMFDAETDREKMKISGSVLTDEEARTLLDRVDGVELKIELTTP